MSLLSQIFHSFLFALNNNIWFFEGNWYPGNVDRQVVPQVRRYGAGQPQLVHQGWGDQSGHQWGGRDHQYQGYQGVGAGHDTFQRVNRGRDF